MDGTIKGVGKKSPSSGGHQAKAPAKPIAGAASLVGRRTRGPEGASAADVAADDLTEQVPLVALELHQLKLRDRSEVGRAGVDLDAGQQAAELQILDVGRLLHDVLSREIVTARLQ